MIYKPRGAAREYGPAALNYYTGCRNGCRYCYVPNMLKQTLNDYRQHETPKENARERIHAAIEAHAGSPEPIFLSFIGDPYCMAETTLKLTQGALVAGLGKTAFVILSKAGTAILRDIDLFKAYGPRIHVGQTLTFSDDTTSAEWEPGAAAPEDRLKSLTELHKQGITTWASFEPVVYITHALEMITRSLQAVDIYKIGKINHNKQIESSQNWELFLNNAIVLLRSHNKRFYIKQALRDAAPRAARLLTIDETDPDKHQPPGWNGGAA